MLTSISAVAPPLSTISTQVLHKNYLMCFSILRVFKDERLHCSSQLDSHSHCSKAHLQSSLNHHVDINSFHTLWTVCPFVGNRECCSAEQEAVHQWQDVCERHHLFPTLGMLCNKQRVERMQRRPR